ncbi:MAG: 16S rRNA (uracil(1498)-N(3))-methyltransferase [Clostridia bacterium]|nr:16S rRNA (uracil(1498)-N(3))-methyltransferase [Clostridia bacterium]
MEHFFLPTVPEGAFTVEGETYRHLTRSRRMAVGETALFSDGKGMDYLAKMTACTKDTATFEVVERRPAVSESGLSITVYQCLPKGDKMEEVLHRCTPLGVTRFVPVQSARSIGIAPNENKRKRWEKIILSAATQSGRSILPELAPVMKFAEAIEEMKQADACFICYENSDAPLPQLPREGSLAFLIGPEGGLAPEEADQLPCCTLGRRILRTEDAAAFLLPILLDRTGNL